MATRLKQLPNGNWVDPDLIRSVRALDECDGFMGGFHPPRVVVDHGAGCSEMIECVTFAAACATRDKIAKLGA